MLFGYAGEWQGNALVGSESRDIAEQKSTHSNSRFLSGPGVSGPWFLAAESVAGEGPLSVAVIGTPMWQSPGGGYQLLASPAREILAAYSVDGDKFLSRLHGRFAIAIVDASRDHHLLAVDRMGIERLCYATQGRGLAFSTSARTLARILPQGAVLRQQAMYDYLLLHMIPSPDTVFTGVRKLEPGTCLVYSSGQVALRRYWDPGFKDRSSVAVDDLRAGLLDQLAAATTRCLPDDRTGAFLSGGLDSSTVAGVLGRVQGHPARTFSMGFGVDSHDELHYARISSRHFGCQAVEYTVTPDDIVKVFTDIATAYDEPFGNSSAVPTLLCARLAKDHGIDHLLAGDGGDEIFGGNERYARQRVSERYWRLPSVLRQKIIEPAVGSLDPESNLKVVRKLCSYVAQARIPMPERLETWNYIYRTSPREIFDADFLPGIDSRRPFAEMQRTFESAGSADLLDRMLHYDWHYTLADNDLRKVGTMCALAGVRVSYPMLDPAVVDLSIRVPSAIKMHGVELRSFYKRSMEGFLPQEILRKEKHGFGLPFGIWMKTHARLRDLILGYFSDVSRRGIFRQDFLDNLLAGHASGHAGYYGYAIWDLAMLEAWMQGAK